MSNASPLQDRNGIAEDPSPRPFLKWAGGKTRLLPELLKRLPPRFSRYHEPFAGGAALYFELQPSPAFLSDINAELINVYQVVRDDVEALIEDLRGHRHDAEYFYALRNADRQPGYMQQTTIARASRFIYLNKTCFNGLYRVNARGEFNVPFGDYVNPTIADAENLRACSRALAGVELNLAAFQQIVDSATAGDFVYFDPPYAPVSETSHFTSYAKGGFGTAMQSELSEVCRTLHERGVYFLLSNSQTSELLNLYKQFQIDVVYAPRAINSKADKRGLVPEILVRNY